MESFVQNENVRRRDIESFMVDKRDLLFVVKSRKWSNKIKLLSDIESLKEMLLICMVKYVQKLIKYVFSFRITQKCNEQQKVDIAWLEITALLCGIANEPKDIRCSQHNVHNTMINFAMLCQQNCEEISW